MVLRKNRKVSVGVDCKDYFVKSKGGIRRWKLTEVEGRMLMEIIGVVICTSRVMKMRENLPFCKEFSILYMEGRVSVDHAES